MSLRKYVQLFFFIITIAGGIRFYMYLQSLRAGDMSAVKPGLVEGFLPISALMSLKQFVLTGVYDMVHPAGLTILISAIVLSVVFKKSFCSHICPVGFVSESLSELSMRIRLNRWLFYILASLKYALLGFFVYIIIINMSTASIASFVKAPYNIVADAKMLDFFLHPSKTTLIVLASLLVFTLLVRNIWCRVLCPYGAMLGLFSVLSPFRVRRDKESCIGCYACSHACPNDILVHKKSTIYSPECMGCLECVRNKTQKNCLTVTHMPFYKYMPLIILSAMLLVFASAYFSGYWNSEVPNQTYLRFLKVLNTLSH